MSKIETETMTDVVSCMTRTGDEPELSVVVGIVLQIFEQSASSHKSHGLATIGS
jgi:hypothetical protein